MLTTDCPICDEPALVDAALAAIECEGCGRLELAADLAADPAQLAIAA